MSETDTLARPTSRRFGCAGASVDVHVPAEWTSIVDGLPLPLAAPPGGRPGCVVTFAPAGGAAAAGELVDTPKVRLATEGVATVFRTRHGLLVRCAEPRGSVLRRLISAVLLNELFTRGYHCLHAAAFAVGGRVALLAGRSGAGKSTLSRAVHQVRGGGLGENYALFDPAYRWTPFLRDFAAAAPHPAPRLGMVVVLEPGAGAPAFTRRTPDLLAGHSVSLHFSDLLADGAGPDARALDCTRAYLAASAAEVWTFAYRPGTDTVEACRERLLNHIEGRMSHGS